MKEWYADEEQKKFWKLFDEILEENGKPFRINYKINDEVKFWASVNRNSCLITQGLTIDFKTREKILEPHIYVRDNLPLFDMFLRNKEEIEKYMEVPLEWRCGKKNPNTRFCAYSIPIRIGDEYDYRAAIEEILPIVIKFIAVIKNTVGGALFDEEEE